MITPRLYLFDDSIARRWAPFTLTRPVGELIFGCATLRGRAEEVFGAPCAGNISRSALVGFDEPGAAPGIRLEQVGREGTRILLSSRAIVDGRLQTLPADPTRLVVDGATVGWVLPDGAPLPSELWLRDPSAAPSVGEDFVIPGSSLPRPWDLVARNPARIAADIAAAGMRDTHPEGIIRIGDGVISLAEDAVIEPGVFVDTRGGPVRLERGARVEGPARLVGPLWIGPGSQVFGGVVGTSSIGPVCKVRGELVESVLVGFDNKAHDGHIGHALLGRWVNLGANTTNSDLKNNYGTVRVWTPDGQTDTGMVKVGCFLGDHTKTGIGTAINTGTVVGAGSNVFGGLMPPTAVPPFSWAAGSHIRDFRLDKFLDTAEKAMGRRGQELTPGVRNVLEEAWNTTAGRRAE